MDKGNDLFELVEKNKFLKAEEKEVIFKFLKEFLMFKKNFNSINLNNFKKNLKDLKFKTVEDINNESFSKYDGKSNTLYLCELNRIPNNEDEVKHDVYRSILECATTKREKGKVIGSGIISNGQNIAMNRALVENILSLMIGCENNILDIEMLNLYKIEEIVGSDFLLEAYFNADYEMLKEKLSKYDISLSTLSKKNDRIMKINLNKEKATENDKNLIAEVDRMLILGLGNKIIQKEQADISRFKEFLITPENGITKFKNKFLQILNNTESNKAFLESFISGINFSVMTTAETTKTK